jgi:hypothetical protein
MARERATVILPWEVVGGFTQMKLPIALPAGASIMDATGQNASGLMPNPNVMIAEVWADTTYIDSLGAIVIERDLLL